MRDRSKSNPTRDAHPQSGKGRASGANGENSTQEAPYWSNEGPVSPINSASNPSFNNSPLGQVVDELAENLPTTLLRPLDEGQQHGEVTRVSPVTEFAQRAAQWRAVAIRLRADIAQINDQLTQMRDQLTYAEVQAATYEQVARAMIQSQPPDEPLQRVY